MKFQVTDPATNDPVVVEASTPQEAVEKYKASKAAPTEKPGLMSRIGSTAEQFLEAPYLEKGKPRKDVSLLGAAVGPVTDVAKGLYGLGKSAVTSLLPPFMTEKPSLSDALSQGGALLLAANPELIPLLSAANVAGEAVYGATGSPLAGGITNQVLSLLTPSGVKKTGEAISSRLLGKEIAAGKEAAKGARAIGVAGGAAKELEAAQNTLKDAEKTLGQFGQQVPKAVKQVKPPVEKTPGEFGKEFVQRAKPEKQVKPGIYQRGREVLKTQADEFYNEARKGTENMEVDATQLAQPLQNLLSKEGIRVQIVPTAAERATAKTAKALGAVDEEEAGFNEAISQLTPEQIEAFKKPGGVVPGKLPFDASRVISSYLEGKTAAAAGKAITRAEDLISLPERLSVRDMIGLRQRFNGLKRAAAQVKNMEVATEYQNLKNIIDKSLPPEVRDKLRVADEFYSERFIPLFGARSGLYRISQQDASTVFNAIVSPKKPERLAEVMSFMEPEEKAALQGAFHQRLTEGATDRFGFHGDKWVAAYDKYAPEVKKELLGDQKGAWDDVANFISHKTETLPKRIEDATKEVQKAEKQAKISSDDAQKMLKIIDDLKKPPELTGGFIRSRARILPILAALDLIKYQVFGIGGSRLLAFALSDVATYSILTNPKILSTMQNINNRSMRVIADVITNKTGGAKYLTSVAALENLLKGASQVEEQNAQ